MAVERYVIQAGIKKVKVKEYLSKELEKAGIGEIDIQRTPMETRVIINALRPGIVIGKKGTTIKALTDTLKAKYGIDNPQIEVNDLGDPDLNAQVMAQNIVSSLERGFHFRRAAYSALRNIMQAGAIGAQITLSGKLTGERSRMEKFVDGYIKYCGEPADRLVLKGFAEAAPKLGRIGVKVRILPPGAKMPDNISIISQEQPPEIALEEDLETKQTPSEPVTEDPVKDAPSKTKTDDKKTKSKTKSAVKGKAKTKKTQTKKTVAVKKEPKAEKGNVLEGSAKEIIKNVKGLTKKDLKNLLKEEGKGKKRKTVIAGIEKLINEG